MNNRCTWSNQQETMETNTNPRNRTRTCAKPNKNSDIPYKYQPVYHASLIYGHKQRICKHIEYIKSYFRSCLYWYCMYYLKVKKLARTTIHVLHLMIWIIMKSRCIISLKLPWFFKINRNAQWGLEAHSILGWFILCDLFIVAYVSHSPQCQCIFVIAE